MTTSARLHRLSYASLALLALVFVAGVMLSNLLLRGWRVDLTENSLYTLSEGTRELLDDIEEPINLYFYYSETATENLPILRTYANRVRELLEEFVEASDGGLELETIDPLPFSEAEDRAAQFGLQAINVGVTPDPIYLGLAGTNSVGDEEVIPFFEPGKERFLEYEIAKLVSALADPERTVVGLLAGLPIEGDFDPQTQRMQPPWVVVDQARQLFELRNVARDVETIDEDVTVLWVVHPNDLPESALYAIDQFILGGGKALIFVDPLAEAGAAAAAPGMPPMGGGSSTLGPLFEAWGLEFDPAEVVLDERLALTVSGGFGSRPTRHPGLLGVTAEHLDESDVITADLSLVNLGSTGHLALAEDAAATLEPLIVSSERAAAAPASRLQFLPDPGALLDEFTPAGESYTLAGRIGGRLPSAFPDGPPGDADAAGNAATDNDGDDAGDVAGSAASDVTGGAGNATSGNDDGTADAASSEPADGNAEAGGGDSGAPALAEAVEDVNVIVVADVDLLSDRLWVQVQNFFGRRIPSAFANNGDFVINALDNLSGSAELISVRSRATFTRPFTRVEALRAEAEARFRATEQRLQNELAETERKLEELQSAREDAGDLLLTPEQQAEIERFIDQRARIRQELRAVQRELDEDIERLGTLLKTLNIGLVPLALMVAGMYLLWRRQRRQHP